MSAQFAATFRELVMPDLRRVARFQGSQVALDLCSFGEACALTWQHAAKRGATCLPHNLLDDLEDWISTMVLKSVDEFTPDVEEYRAIVDRVALDIARCEAAWQTT